MVSKELSSLCDRVLVSPNYDERPPTAEVKLVIIHAISLPPEQFSTGHIEDFFMNVLDCEAHPYFKDLTDVRVSCHYFIDRNGSLIQFVAPEKRAWHAGRSRWRDWDACNDFSIGIELEGSDLQKFSDPQYHKLQILASQLIKDYPRLTPKEFVGHSDVAPHRKTDPGPFFDWDRFRENIKL